MKLKAFGVEINVRRLRKKEKPVSTFTAYLRAQGRDDLCPDDEEPRALANRVALLINKNATRSQFDDLNRLWLEWRNR